MQESAALRIHGDEDVEVRVDAVQSCARRVDDVVGISQRDYAGIFALIYIAGCIMQGAIDIARGTGGCVQFLILIGITHELATVSIWVDVEPEMIAVHDRRERPQADGSAGRRIKRVEAAEIAQPVERSADRTEIDLNDLLVLRQPGDGVAAEDGLRRLIVEIEQVVLRIDGPDRSRARL